MSKSESATHARRSDGKCATRNKDFLKYTHVKYNTQLYDGGTTYQQQPTTNLAHSHHFLKLERQLFRHRVRLTEERRKFTFHIVSVIIRIHVVTVAILVFLKHGRNRLQW